MQEKRLGLSDFPIPVLNIVPEIWGPDSPQACEIVGLNLYRLVSFA